MSYLETFPALSEEAVRSLTQGQRQSTQPPSRERPFSKNGLTLEEELSIRDHWLSEIEERTRTSSARATPADMFWTDTQRFIEGVTPLPNDSQELDLMNELESRLSDIGPDLAEATRTWHGTLDRGK